MGFSFLRGAEEFIDVALAPANGRIWPGALFVRFYGSAANGRPKSSNSGQRNQFKPGLENQSLAENRLEGFLGKGIRNFNRL